MNLYKIIFSIFILIIISAPLFINTQIQKNKKDRINPVSSENNFYNQLNHALKIAKLNTTATKIYSFNNELEFNIINTDNNQTKTKISSNKNPYYQVASLQEIFKIAKIKGKYVKYIDLSIDHPYVTF